MNQATSVAAVPEKAMRKVALTALAGTSIEWYDFFLYGTAAALVFPVLFFPPDLPPLVGLLASFSTFAVGFVARPVGGILFGHYGDRVGRKQTLVTALLLMGVSTTLIGFLPSYATMGAAAPLILVLLRFAQGLAIGGQWGGAMLLVTESAPPEKRGYYGSFAQVGAPVGVILANLAFLAASTLLPQEAFMEWGWRLPFLASVVLIGLSMYVQLRVEDTPAFRELANRKGGAADPLPTAPVRPRGSPIVHALRAYPKEIMLAAGAFLGVQVSFYILIAFVVAYGSNPAGLGLSRNTMLIAVLIAAAVQIPATVAAAAYSDRHGRRGVYMAGAVLSGLWAFALFPLIDTGSFLWITVAISVGLAFVGMMYGPQAALLAELFSTEVRYSGASLGYQIGAILGGALAPLIATALLDRTGSTFGIAVYICLACVATLACVLLLAETHRNSLHAEVAAEGRGVSPPDR